MKRFNYLSFIEGKGLCIAQNDAQFVDLLYIEFILNYKSSILLIFFYIFLCQIISIKTGLFEIPIVTESCKRFIWNSTSPSPVLKK